MGSPGPRRSVIGWLALGVAVTLGAAGCGFHLRGAARLPFDSIYLGFGPGSQFGYELARNIRSGTGTQVVADRSRATAIVEVLGENRERDVLSFNAQGRIREIQLRLRISVRVHDGKGRDFIAPTQLIATRDLAFDESKILANEAEEALIYRDMQTDLVQQLLRRLSAIAV